MSLGEVVGLDLQLSLVREAHAEDRPLSDELGGESARVVTCQQYPMGVLVEESSDGVQVSKGEQSAVVQYDDLLGNALYLLEDVARMWLDISTVLPCEPSSRITLMMLVRAIGSQPCNGSSRMMRSGS